MRKAGKRSVSFHSIVFIEFALLFFLGWKLIGRRKPAALWFLVLASWGFYGYATWWFVPILVGTATVDWALALAMLRWPTWKKTILVSSCVSNLGVLGLFKYSGFFVENVNAAFGLHFLVPSLLLPVGISFYTFQSLSYVIDVYRGETQPTSSWVEFLAIVSMFAHLVAGPIVRVSRILPQIRELRKPSEDEIWGGIDLICVGLFKKIVLADRLAAYVDAIYQQTHPTGASAVLATVSFAFQVYYDFSGYTDIARGLARWLGLDFGVNFNHPFTAIGLTDFWTRWHISLTTWVRDYVYIPLGGNQRGEWMTYRNLWISMILSALWHGASWTFVAWGALHALFLTIERLTQWPKRLSQTKIGRLLAVIITFSLFCLALAVFRADSIPRAAQLLLIMAVPTGSLGMQNPTDYAVLVIVASGILYELNVLFGFRKTLSIPGLSQTNLAMRNGILLAMCIVAPGISRAFFYFQF